MIEESIALLEKLPPSVSLAAAYANKAAVNMYEDPEVAVSMAQRAREILERNGLEDAGVVSDSLNTEGSALFARGEDGVPQMRAALETALAGDAEETACRAYTNIVALLGSSYRLTEALTYTTEGLEFGEDRDLDLHLNCLRGNHIDLMQRRGQWDDAVEIGERELLKPTLSAFNRSGPCLTLALIHGRRGNWAVADALLAEAEDAGQMMHAVNRLEIALAAVELHWLRGADAQARQLAVDAGTLCTPPAELAGPLAVWLRRLGVDAPDPVATGPHRRQLVEHWSAVAGMWREIGAPYEQALALYDSGEEEPMREAIAILDSLGATATINVVRAEMRRRGFRAIPRGSRSTTRADELGLTARQREVLELLVEGLTNADISTKLVLSERTVDHHVGAILAKLGVESRRDVARVVAESRAVTAASG